METVGYGFLLGLGFMLAFVLVAAAVGLLVVGYLFVDYLRSKKKAENRVMQVPDRDGL